MREGSQPYVTELPMGPHWGRGWRQVLLRPEHPEPVGGSQGGWGLLGTHAQHPVWVPVKGVERPQCGDWGRRQILRLAFASLISKPAFSTCQPRERLWSLSLLTPPSFVLSPPLSKPVPSYLPWWSILRRSTRSRQAQGVCPAVRAVGPPRSGDNYFMKSSFCFRTHIPW